VRPDARFKLLFYSSAGANSKFTAWQKWNTPLDEGQTIVHVIFEVEATKRVSEFEPNH
jgi:hypothetical protein